jgi:hypothetical protein
MSITLTLPNWTWRSCNKTTSRYVVITGILPLQGNERLVAMVPSLSVVNDHIYLDFSTQGKQVYHRKGADGTYEWEFQDHEYMKVAFASGTVIGATADIADFQSIPVEV